MRGLLVLLFALLVVVNTVNSGAIYRRYRQIDIPLSNVNGQSDAQAVLIPAADNYVSELRKNQIPVQVVQVVEPVVLLNPAESQRSVQPQIALAESEPSALISNEIIPEKLEKLEEKLEEARGIEQAVVAQEQELQKPIIETVVAIEEEPEQGQQQLRNIPAEAAAPVILMEEAPIVLKEKKPEPEVLLESQPEVGKDLLLKQIPKELPKELPEELPKELAKELPKELPVELPKELPEETAKELLVETEKKLVKEALKLPESLPESLPKELPQEPLPAAPVKDEEKPEEPKPLAAELPALKALKEEEPAKEILPEASAPLEAAAPVEAEQPSELKSLDELPAPSEFQPQLKKLEEASPEMRPLLEERKEEVSEKKEEIVEEKKELLKAAEPKPAEENIQIIIKPAEPAQKEEEAPISGRQADTADPAPTTARPTQQPAGFIQQLVQNSPLGQLLNNFNGANSQAAPEQNTPVATAATFIQALQNTTSQITNSIQQGFQQQLQSLQTTFTGQQPQQAAASGDAAAASAPTTRPPGPFQSIVTSFLGNGQNQQPAAPAPAPQGGPLQGILNLFGGNRAPTTVAPAAAAPAADAAPVKEAEAAPAAPAAEEEIRPEAARESAEAGVADDSLEAVKPDEIVVNDDDTPE